MTLARPPGQVEHGGSWLTRWGADVQSIGLAFPTLIHWLDIRGTEDAEVAVKPDIIFASLTTLAYVLRHPETWPKSFDWDNRYYETSAVGLLLKKWVGPGFNADDEICRHHYAVMLKTTPEIVRKLFVSLQATTYCVFGVPIFPRSYLSVTPEMVAEQIERYITRNE
jgi:hypothetical protein